MFLFDVIIVNLRNLFIILGFFLNELIQVIKLGPERSVNF